MHALLTVTCRRRQTTDSTGMRSDVRLTTLSYLLFVIAHKSSDNVCCSVTSVSIRFHKLNNLRLLIRLGYIGLHVKFPTGNPVFVSSSGCSRPCSPSNQSIMQRHCTMQGSCDVMYIYVTHNITVIYGIISVDGRRRKDGCWRHGFSVQVS